MSLKTPAQQLEGLTLDGGWKVVRAARLDKDRSGGNFSEGYIAQREDGKRGFLKAPDFLRLTRNAQDQIAEMERLAQAFRFERDVLRACRDRRLNRVVTVIAEGQVSVAGYGVPYLILELADADVRTLVKVSKRFDLAWLLRSLHHVATGLNQLHGLDIAHQDVKPSNVLFFEEERATKLGDLGRAAQRGYSPPHEGWPIAGDPAYAPPELHYRYLDPDWNRRRRGCDVYLLGSMAVFFFTGVGTTPLLRKELNDAHAWGVWQATYEEVLPYVRDAFGRVLQTFRAAVDAEVRDELVTIVSQLCEPDPRLRGHPLNRAGMGSPYSLERYVSRFDFLASKAEVRLQRMTP